VKDFRNLKKKICNCSQLRKYSRTWDNVTSHRDTAANTNVATLASYISSPRVETVTEVVKNVEKGRKRIQHPGAS